MMGGGLEGGGVGRGGGGWLVAMLGLGFDVGYGVCTKNRRYCTMYKKVLYNIKNIKKNVGGGMVGAIFEPKTPSMYLKKKINIRAGIRTHDIRVRKTCFLIHLAKHYYSNFKI